MWKQIVEGITESVSFELSSPRIADWPWRKILADAALVAALVLSSSWIRHVR